MKRAYFGSAAAIALLVAVLGGTVLLLWALNSWQTFAIPVWACVFLSFVTPFTIIAIRHQIRRTRVKHIELFAQSFDFDTPANTTSGASVTPKTRKYDNVSFEFVRAKYFADLDDDKPYDKRTIDDIPKFPMMLHADWMLLFCAIPFIVFSGFGIFILFAPLSELSALGSAIARWLPPSILTAGGSGVTDDTELAALNVNILTIAGLTFAGGYFYTLRLFLRAVAVFDLSPITFLRAFAHMVLSVTLAVVLYRVLPSYDALQTAWASFTGLSAEGKAQPDLQGVASDTAQGVDKMWFVFALALGFIPESALDYLLRLSRLTFKRRYSALEMHAPLIPLTVLDGIDFVTAFRLEEANIYDMQNLATYNPIMLHIESPFGIYETIDWVAQAQLCTVVGPERFLLLKSLNIRTIFDLQQAVLMKDADADIRKAVSDILIQDCVRDRNMRARLIVGLSSSSDGPPPASALPAALTEAAVVHLTRVMLDDLHVHRLRQVWNRIAVRLEWKPPMLDGADALDNVVHAVGRDEAIVAPRDRRLAANGTGRKVSPTNGRAARVGASQPVAE
jgi:hypothetical protein